MIASLNARNQANFDAMEHRWLDCPDDENVRDEDAIYCDHCGRKGTKEEIRDRFTVIDGREVYETLCDDCASELGYIEDDEEYEE